MTSPKTASPSSHYIFVPFLISGHSFYTMAPIEFDHPHEGRKVKSCVLENDPPPRFDNLFAITAAVTACATLFHCIDLRPLLLLLLLLLAVKPRWHARWWLRQLFSVGANRLSCSWCPPSSSSSSSAQGCTGQERWCCRSRQGGSSRLGCRFERGLSAAAAGSGSGFARTNGAAGFLTNGGDSAAAGSRNGTEGIRIGVRSSCISSGKQERWDKAQKRKEKSVIFFTDVTTQKTRLKAVWIREKQSLYFERNGRLAID